MHDDPPAGATATADAATTADAICNVTVNTATHTTQPPPAEVDLHGNEVFQYKEIDEPHAVVEASSETNTTQEQPGNNLSLSTLNSLRQDLRDDSSRVEDSQQVHREACLALTGADTSHESITGLSSTALLSDPAQGYWAVKNRQLRRDETKHAQALQKTRPMPRAAPPSP